MIIIAQYQGVSPVSWVIKKQTRSIWSHTAPILPDQSVVEAWYKVGVDHVNEGSLIANLSKNHRPGTVVDLFRIEATDIQADDFYTKAYDTTNTTGFGWFIFYNSTTAKATQNSNAIPYAGFENNSVKKILDSFFSQLNNKELKLISNDDAFIWLRSEEHTSELQSR